MEKPGGGGVTEGAQTNKIENHPRHFKKSFVESPQNSFVELQS